MFLFSSTIFWSLFAVFEYLMNTAKMKFIQISFHLDCFPDFMKNKISVDKIVFCSSSSNDEKEALRELLLRQKKGSNLDNSLEVIENIAQRTLTLAADNPRGVLVFGIVIGILATSITIPSVVRVGLSTYNIAFRYSTRYFGPRTGYPPYIPIIGGLSPFVITPTGIAISV